LKIQESAENYLEQILVLSREKGKVRSVDIAEEMGFSKPSVSHAMKQFRENGYITVDEGGQISLTDKGRLVAERTYERHQLLTDYFQWLGVSEETAKEDACRIEHYISEETFRKIREHYETMAD